MTETNNPELSKPEISHTNEVRTRWWVRAEAHRDAYGVYVLKDKFIDGKCELTWVLDLVGNWNEIAEGREIYPCMVLNGQMIHALSQGGPLDRGHLAVSLEFLAKEIVTELITKLAKAGEVE